MMWFIKPDQWNVKLAAALALMMAMTACNQESGEEGADYLLDEDELQQLEDDYAAAKQHAMRNVEVIREFHELYPEAIGFFSHYNMDNPSWNSTTWLYDRYELNLKLPVELSEDRRSIINTAEPFFQLGEITRIEVLEDGRFRVRSGDGWSFGQEKWEELKRAEGRIEEVFTERTPDPPGVSIPADREPFEGIRVDDPVPSFDAYVERMKPMEQRPE